MPDTAPVDAQAIFTRDGDWLAPTPLAGGPWSPDAQHGGAAAGLLARAVESCTPAGMRVTRLAIDLLGEVPMQPLRATARVVRPGRRIQLVDAQLENDERTLARATAQLVRAEAVPGVEPWLAEDVPHATSPEATSPAGFPEGLNLPGWVRALDIVRPAAPSREAGGVMWARPRVPLVEGESWTPLQRLAAVSDFASGAGNGLDYARFVSINPDLTLHIEREPVSDWVGVAGKTRLSPDGTGQSHATLHDLKGQLGRALASLYVAPR